MNTEGVDPRYDGIESRDSTEMARILLDSQLDAAEAARAAAPALALAIDAGAARLAAGGRLLYLGAGTSGRLAALDAAELAPTFDWPPERSLALIAGGPRAMTTAIEGAEDDGLAALAALAGVGMGAGDVVIGVAASGRTPYTLAGIEAGRTAGALTMAVTNVTASPLAKAAEIALIAQTGAEVLAGSTRMKAGTAQKILLNALSTGIMMRLGRVYRGRMVAMRPTNEKLQARAVAMVADLSGVAPEVAAEALRDGGTIAVAVVMLARGIAAQDARERLEKAGGILVHALG